jgi:hypothetical protein
LKFCVSVFKHFDFEPADCDEGERAGEWIACGCLDDSNQVGHPCRSRPIDRGSDALDLEKLSGFDAAVAGDDRRGCLSLLIIVDHARLSYKDQDRPGPGRW